MSSKTRCQDRRHQIDIYLLNTKLISIIKTFSEKKPNQKRSITDQKKPERNRFVACHVKVSVFLGLALTIKSKFGKKLDLQGCPQKNSSKKFITFSPQQQKNLIEFNFPVMVVHYETKLRIQLPKSDLKVTEIFEITETKLHFEIICAKKSQYIGMRLKNTNNRSFL